MRIEFEAHLRIRTTLQWIDLIPIVFTIAECVLL